MDVVLEAASEFEPATNHANQRSTKAPQPNRNQRHGSNGGNASGSSPRMFTALDGISKDAAGRRTFLFLRQQAAPPPPPPQK
jgi:hypothetical protein